MADEPVRDLTDEEYDATYRDAGTTGGHEIPADVMAAALAEARGDVDNG